MYDLPYLAHATMEPMNCVADVRTDRCEVWVGTQMQTADRAAAAEESGLKPEQVTLHTTLLGGGFGRRAAIDNHFVREAVQISKAVRAPVKVIWTREDDMRGGYYRPRAYHTVRAAMDGAGKPVAWEQHIVCQSFIIGTPYAAMIKDGLDELAVEGAKDIPYAIPNVRVDWHPAPNGVPTFQSRVRITVWRRDSGSSAGVTVSCRRVTSTVLRSVLASASICGVSPRRRMSRPRSAPACSRADGLWGRRGGFTEDLPGFPDLCAGPAGRAGRRPAGPERAAVAPGCSQVLSAADGVFHGCRQRGVGSGRSRGSKSTRRSPDLGGKARDDDPGANAPARWAIA